MMKYLVCAAVSMSASCASYAGLIENFDNVSGLTAKGFVLRNASSPEGTNGFFQGNDMVFDAQSGLSTAYLGANYESAAPGGIIDDWLITPLFSTTTGGTISFYARGAAEAGFADTFQYGISSGGTLPGDFTLNALSVVSTAGWTRYTYQFNPTGTEAPVGRFAIRYVGEADRLNYVGVDSLEVALPEPNSLILFGMGLLGLHGFCARRRNGRGETLA